MTSQPTPTTEDLQSAQALIAQMKDPQWALAAAQLEEELEGDISAGPELGRGLGRMLADPAGFAVLRRLGRDLIGSGPFPSTAHQSRSDASSACIMSSVS